MTRRDVERFQDQGIAVIPWTVNKPKAIARMIDWGVDGLITDYPDRARQILQQTTGRCAVEP